MMGYRYKKYKMNREDNKARLAQLAERSLSKRKVGGSIPPVGYPFSYILWNYNFKIINTLFKLTHF